jgi:N-acetylglutamate synthase-like GNAT family acetyltransferase
MTDSQAYQGRETFAERERFATKIFTRPRPLPTLRPMSSPNYSVRRATVDDLRGLKELWARARLQLLDLEKRLTEFQLVVSDEGNLVGAIGLHIAAKQGKLHSEAFTHPENEDQFRPQLWERIQTVARNHGLVRLWTQEAAPFWSRSGFIDATPEILKKLPATFGDPHLRWLTLQIKEETIPTLSLDQEFELFQQAQRQSTERVMQQARKLKTMAYLIGSAVLLAAILGAVLLFQQISRQKRRSPQTPPVQTNQPPRP